MTFKSDTSAALVHQPSFAVRAI